MSNHLKHELHDIISGKNQVRHGTIIQSIASYLGHGAETGSKIEDSKQIREQEKKKLERFVSENNLWAHDIDFAKYVSEGAEQRVFLKNSDHVIKLNDAIYYSSWKDYLYSLLFHNYFFTDTAYELIGFSKEKDILYAVVQQPYVAITHNTDLDKVKVFLESNGFINTRNNDYFNPELGVILEDLHDENVLTRNGILYFVDTVFFTTEKFWIKEP